jgi:hypothetical protein
MNYSGEFYLWILNIIFIIGVLLLPVGLGFCFLPDKMFKLANRMNKWIVTDHFFNAINKPRYKEHFFYRHHKLVGFFIVVLSVMSLYSLTFYMGIDRTTDILLKFSESEFEKWIFVVLYYSLIVAISLSIIFGIIMFIRPSLLKSFEEWSNHWIDTDTPLKKLDKQNNIPDKILPGKEPRIFGVFIILAAFYIIWSTY